MPNKFSSSTGQTEEMKMNLQLFAEGADTPDAQQLEGAQADAQTEESPERTFSQADVDRIVAERLARANRDTESRIRAARQEGRTEAERLAQMTEAQRTEHERQEAERVAREREEGLAQREQAIARRELRAQAIDILVSRELPRGLADVLDYSSVDACNASITTIEREFRAAVQQGVDARLRASSVNLPAHGSQPDYAHMSDADYYAATLNKAKG